MSSTSPAAPGLADKLRWLAFGTALTFLVFEGGLRLAGLFLAPAPSEGEARYTILCEGDSFTYGIGGQAFPDQLERILNERAGERLFRTINTAVPGINTTLLADDLDVHLLEHKPDLLIVTTGENNSWNAIRLQAPDQSAWTRLEGYLLYSRVYKFVKVAREGWNKANFHEGAAELVQVQQAANYLTDYEETIGMPQEQEEQERPPTLYDERQLGDYRRAWELRDAGQYDESNAVFRQLISETPREVHGYLGLAGSLMRQDNLDEATLVLQQSLQADTAFPAPAETYFALGWAFRRKERYDKAIEAWTEGLRVYPLSGKLYQAIANCYYQIDHDIWKALTVAEQVPAVAENPLHRYLAALSQMSEGYSADDVRALVSDSFRRDMEQIARTAALRDVPLILSSYPTHAYDEVKQTAEKFGATYVDFRPVFAANFRSKEEFLGPDGCHCNTAGYRLMAEALADQVEELLALNLPNSPNARVDLHPTVEGPGFVPGPRDRPRSPEERAREGQQGPPGEHPYVGDGPPGEHPYVGDREGQPAPPGPHPYVGDPTPTPAAP
jgi:lysophospholipase L1-like esterase